MYGEDGAAIARAVDGGAGRLTDLGCRALDIAGALVLLIVLAPILALVALLLKFDSPGPVLFRQQRLGREGRPFTVNKFRTMYHGVEHDRHREFVLALISGEQDPAPSEAEGDGEGGEEPQFKLTDDTRVTRLGHLLRRSSVDELPQLLNVLRGEMSLVGPRPPIPYEVEGYPSHWFARFAVKPGMTGLWQVAGRSQVPLEEMVRLDIEYARRRSLWLNVQIMLRTVPAVLSRRGAW